MEWCEFLVCPGNWQSPVHYDLRMEPVKIWWKVKLKILFENWLYSLLSWRVFFHECYICFYHFLDQSLWMELRVKMITPQAAHNTGYLTSLSFPIPLFTNTKIGLNPNKWKDCVIPTYVQVCTQLLLVCLRKIMKLATSMIFRKPVAKIAKNCKSNDFSHFFCQGS